MPAVPGREVVRTSGGVTTRQEPVRVRRFQWHAPPCVRRRRDQTVRPPVRTASPRGGELGEGGARYRRQPPHHQLGRRGVAVGTGVRVGAAGFVAVADGDVGCVAVAVGAAGLVAVAVGATVRVAVGGMVAVAVGATVRVAVGGMVAVAVGATVRVAVGEPITGVAPPVATAAAVKAASRLINPAPKAFGDASVVAFVVAEVRKMSRTCTRVRVG